MLVPMCAPAPSAQSLVMRRAGDSRGEMNGVGSRAAGHAAAVAAILNRAGHQPRRRRGERDVLDHECIFIGPAAAEDVVTGYAWRWQVVHAGQRRSGACGSRGEAEREARMVLELLSQPHEHLGPDQSADAA